METQSRQSILVVDDDEVIRDLVVRFLTLAGWPCLSAEDGLDALAVFGEGKGIAVVVTDLEMPRMDGLGLIRRLRELAPTVPVALMSALLTEAVTAEAVRRGAIAILDKSKGVRMVAERIREIAMTHGR